LNWPSVSTGENFFDRALANGRLEIGPDVAYPNGVHETGVTAESALDAWAKEEERDEIDLEEGGWDLDAGKGVIATQDQLDEEAVAAEMEIGAGATPGLSDTELWFVACRSQLIISLQGCLTAMQVCIVLLTCLVLRR
jgi:coatomer protein complex subunit alpha (xenin)